MSNHTSVEGTVALVTGANRGIGAAFVSGLLEAGTQRVYAAARDPGIIHHQIDVDQSRGGLQDGCVVSDVERDGDHAGIALRKRRQRLWLACRRVDALSAGLQQSDDKGRTDPAIGAGHQRHCAYCACTMAHWDAPLIKCDRVVSKGSKQKGGANRLEKKLCREVAPDVHQQVIHCVLHIYRTAMRLREQDAAF